MTFEEFEKVCKVLGQKIGFTNKFVFMEVHKMIEEGETIKAVGSCVGGNGDGAIIVTERNFYSSQKTGLISTENTVIPLEKITSFSSSGFIPKLLVSEGTLVHTYPTVNNIDRILAAIKAGKSAPSPEVTPVKQQDATDELRKFKSLLDDGVITQEDFDAKKKQLLNL
jgi:hypothetical protein